MHIRILFQLDYMTNQFFDHSSLYLTSKKASLKMLYHFITIDPKRDIL